MPIRMKCTICNHKLSEDTSPFCDECLIMIDFIEKLKFVCDEEIGNFNSVNPQLHGCFQLLNTIASLVYKDRNLRFYLQACMRMALHIQKKERKSIDFRDLIHSASERADPKIIAFPFIISNLLVENDFKYDVTNRLLAFFSGIDEILNPNYQYNSLVMSEQTYVRTLFGYIVLVLFQQLGRQHLLVKRLNLKKSWVKIVGIFAYAYLSSDYIGENEMEKFLKSRKVSKVEINDIMALLLGLDLFNRNDVIIKSERRLKPGKLGGELILRLNPEYLRNVEEIRKVERILDRFRNNDRIRS